MNSGEWTRTEEHVLTANYNIISLDRLAEMLPGRSRGAIVTRAQMLGLHKKEQVMPTKTAISTASTIEKLEAEVAIKKAQLEVEQTDQALVIFDELLVQHFTGDADPQEFVKLSSNKRSKLVAALSRARLKLAMARMREKQVG